MTAQNAYLIQIYGGLAGIIVGSGVGIIVIVSIPYLLANDPVAAGKKVDEYRAQGVMRLFMAPFVIVGFIAGVLIASRIVVAFS